MYATIKADNPNVCGWYYCDTTKRLPRLNIYIISIKDTRVGGRVVCVPRAETGK